jgi:hypothetical protein
LSPAPSAATARSGSTTRSPVIARRIAGVKRAPQIAGPAERREDQDPDSRQLAAQELGDVEPAGAGHLDVEQGDVGLRGARGAQHLVAAPDLGDDLDVVLEAEQRRERLAHHRLVLGDEHPDHASGTSTRNR